MDKSQGFKSWELKVAVHCDGCARKVKKSLQSIDGVYRVSVDSAMQKVTVEGESKLSSDVLIKKLAKIGKPADLWPEDLKQKTSSDEKKRELARKLGDHKDDKKKSVDAGSKQEGKKTEKDGGCSSNATTSDSTSSNSVNVPQATNNDGNVADVIRQDLSQALPPESFGMYPLNPSVVQYTVHYHTVDPYVLHHDSRSGKTFCCEMPCYYSPPPENLHFNTDIFNDENTSSCTLM